MNLIESINWEKVGGLIPAIIQNSTTAEVLMLGYMNPEALEISIKQNKVVFFSRTKNRLWLKGETSGNELIIKKISLDCDQDSILILVEPIGQTCHLGQNSCYGNTMTKLNRAINDLEQTINQRKLSMPENSYTTALIRSGINKISQKVGEEAVEVVIAAINEDNKSLINETADLIYHLLVLLSVKNISLNDVSECLSHRKK